MKLKVFISGLIVAFVFNSVGYAQNVKPDGAGGFDTLGVFKKLCDRIRDTKGDYTLGGIINIKNPTNPTLELKNVSFLFCKSGSRFYYKLGTAEMINNEGVYLYIDHDRRNIMLSPQKEVAYDQTPLNMPDVSTMMKTEHYRVSSSDKGNERTITLLNEHHVSCKQYSLTFDKDNLRLRRLFMRLTDLRNPDNSSTEEVVDVQITQWNRTADLSKYLNKRQVISIRGQMVSGTGNFKNYRVIKM